MSEQQTPAAIPHHWIMTLQTSDGRQGTNGGSIDVTPGTHTDATTYSVVLAGMRKWIGSENVTVLFYRLTPNEISAPAATR